VEFDGEEGIDEGGLQKEFFQLLVEKLFDPMNGNQEYNIILIFVVCIKTLFPHFYCGKLQPKDYVL
jgi:hypothetical protein